MFDISRWLRKIVSFEYSECDFCELYTKSTLYGLNIAGIA